MAPEIDRARRQVDDVSRIERDELLAGAARRDGLMDGRHARMAFLLGRCVTATGCRGGRWAP